MNGGEAVHLELVSYLSTSAFLVALNRFVSRRGLLSDIYSDCGINIIGSSKQLQQIFSDSKTKDLFTACIHAAGISFPLARRISGFVRSGD